MLSLNEYFNTEVSQNTNMTDYKGSDCPPLFLDKKHKINIKCQIAPIFS